MHPARPVLNSVLCMCVLGLWGLSGCADGVQEDRTVTFSADGGSTGFQHGNEGVFLVDRQTGNLENIFRPDENVLATSTPLWSPADKRVVFTTAQATEGNQSRQPSLEEAQALWDQTPGGAMYSRQPITYTCWLREEHKGDQTPQPTKVFDAACDHVGYVAASLAVRWHPAGDRIVYIDKTAEGMHSLFEYDLAGGKKRRIFARSAVGIIFDWTPDGSRLVCVLGGSGGSSEDDGIWIGRPDADDWWHVQEWSKLNQTGLIESLRARRPAWTVDGSQFAFAIHEPGTPDGQPGKSLLYRGTPATRKVELLLQTNEPVRDLFWSPDQRRIGFVRGAEVPSLHLLHLPEGKSKPVSERPVRRFAGWNTTGNRLAYVVPEAVSPTGRGTWAVMFFANPNARDAVYVTDGAGSSPDRVVFSGLRVTFPLWSPTADKLSLWATFNPTHQSWFSLFLRWGLQPGDPAAVFDMQTGNMEWMAINAFEKAQVGHYYLLKRDYAEARKWYDEAAAKLPPPEPVTIDNINEPLQGPRHFAFFHYYCLDKLGLKEEAQAKLNEFTRLYDPSELESRAEEPVRSEPPDRQTRERLELLVALARNTYIAEVFLSLDAAGDGREFFTAFVSRAETDVDRLAAAVVLGQLLLLENKHREYAELTTASVAPLLMTVWTAPSTGPAGVGQNGRLQSDLPLVFIVGASLLPMYSPEFLATLPAEQLQALVPRWQAMRSKAKCDVTRLGVDLFLQAAFRQLDRRQEKLAVDSRIEQNPSRARLLPAEGIVQLIEEFRRLRQVAASQPTHE